VPFLDVSETGQISLKFQKDKISLTILKHYYEGIEFPDMADTLMLFISNSTTGRMALNRFNVNLNSRIAWIA